MVVKLVRSLRIRRRHRYCDAFATSQEKIDDRRSDLFVNLLIPTSCPFSSTHRDVLHRRIREPLSHQLVRHRHASYPKVPRYVKERDFGT
jgi:hypothetical protein